MGIRFLKTTLVVLALCSIPFFVFGPSVLVVPTKEKNVNLLFVGDIMLDRSVAKLAEKKGVDSLLSKAGSLFVDIDATIGNLEGTITDKKSVAQVDPNILRFTFDPKFASWLSTHRFTAVSLANNHALDFYQDGYDQTTENLKRVGVNFFGSPLNDQNLSTSISVREKNICLVGYHDLFTQNEDGVIKEIETKKSDCSFVVLFAHWGVEYEKKPTVRQTSLAHRFIDAGADLVIGAHPHVVQTLEIYKNKAIFYSLGNFIFDQYFSFETEHGLAVKVSLSEKETKYTLVPIFIHKAEVEITNEKDKVKTISSLITPGLPANIASDIVSNHEFVLQN